MKTRIDKNIYETTIEFLIDRMALYWQVMDATKSEKQKAKEQKLIDDCRKLKECIEENFEPGR